MTRILNRHGVVAVTAALLLIVAPAAQGQDSELRRENEALRARNQDLTRELETAHQRITELEAQVEQLRRALRQQGGTAGTPGVSPPPPLVTIDESESHASPRALFAALQEGYAEAVGEREAGAPDSPERRAYLQAIRGWASSANQRHRASIDWIVRLDDVWHEGRAWILEVTAVDPETHAELGDPFKVELSRGQVRQLEMASRSASMDFLRLRGALRPMVRINEGRELPGAFDNPRLIGPWAEYMFTVDVSAVAPVREERAEGGD